MKTMNIALITTATVTGTTLRGVAARVLAFLMAGNQAPIKTRLLPLGWQAGAKEGWALIRALDGTSKEQAAFDAVPAAIAGCEKWQASGLVRARAMLQLRFPDQSDFIFHDLVPANGAVALLNVASFLQRRELLENGSERKASRKADHEALAVLEASGVTKAVLKELAAFVATAQTVVDDGASAAAQEKAAAEHDILLRKMHAWLTAWSEMARTVITRRDELIRLGLAKRRSKKAKAAKAPAAPPVVVPVVTPPVVTPPVVVAPPVVTPPVATAPVAAPPVATTPVAAPVNALSKLASEPDDIAPASRAA